MRPSSDLPFVALSFPAACVITITRYKQRSEGARRWRNADPASVVTLDDHAGTVFGVTTVPGHPNLIASGGEDAVLRVWNTATTRVVVAEGSNNLSVRIATTCVLSPGAPVVSHRPVRRWAPSLGARLAAKFHLGLF